MENTIHLAGSPSPGGHVKINIVNVNQLSLPTPFYSTLMSISASALLSTIVFSINSPNNTPVSSSLLKSVSDLI